MPQALNVSSPSVSLAYWLALNVPDLFLWEWGRVKRSALAAQISAGLGQDDDDDDDDDDDEYDEEESASDYTDESGGVLEESSPQSVLGIDTSAVQTVSESDLTTTPGLVDVSSDAMSDVTNALGETGSSSAPTSSGAAANMVSAVGAALSSPQEVANLANAALTYFAAQSTPVVADVFATQVATVAAGQPVQPLTTATGADGVTQAAQVSTNADGSTTVTPLTAAQLAALTPSGLTVFLAQYGVYLGIGGALLLIALLARRRHR